VPSAAASPSPRSRSIRRAAGARWSPNTTRRRSSRRRSRRRVHLHELLEDQPVGNAGAVAAERMNVRISIGQQGAELLPDGSDDVSWECGHRLTPSSREASDTPWMIEHPCPTYTPTTSLLAEALTHEARPQMASATSCRAYRSFGEGSTREAGTRMAPYHPPDFRPGFKRLKLGGFGLPMMYLGVWFLCLHATHRSFGASPARCRTLAAPRFRNACAFSHLYPPPLHVVVGLITAMSPKARFTWRMLGAPPSATIRTISGGVPSHL
jgi:hypothetical protein